MATVAEVVRAQALAGWQAMLPVLHVDWPGVGNRAGSLSSGAGSQAVIDLPMPPITQQPLADWG